MLSVEKKYLEDISEMDEDYFVSGVISGRSPFS